MAQPAIRDIAQDMIRLHGLRAQAVANERIAELRAQGDTAGLDRWQAVQSAIQALRRAANQGAPADSNPSHH